MRPKEKEEQREFFRYTNTPVSGEVNSLVFGYQRCTAGEMVGPPGTKPHFVLHYILSGRGRFVLDGRSYDVEAGGLFFIPPDLTFAYQSSETDPWEYVWIEFGGTGAAALCAQAGLTASSPVCRLESPAAAEEAWKLAASPVNPLATDLYALSVLYRLLSLLLEERQPAPEHVMKSRLVEYVGRYIADHLEDPELGLSQLSRVFFVSPAYLSRIFRERNGVTVSRQITVARIQRARRLLDDGCSVAETARRTGFSSPQYFSAVFRRYTGTAPSRYHRGVELPSI